MQVVHIHIPRTGGSSLDNRLTKSRVDVISGHFGWGVHPPQDGRLFVIVLREPVARAASVYSYIRNKPEHKLHRLYAIKTPLELLETKPGQLSNGQVVQLSPEKDLDAALAILARPDVHLMTTERIADGVAALSRRIGIELPPPAHMNTAPALDLDPETAGALAEANRLDAALYEAALELIADRSELQARPPG
jgi:hypothetical protein